MTNTNTSNKTRKLVTLSLLTAITILMGFTIIGYIPTPTMKITLICIPVIIGVILEGLGAGLFLGAIFGITSFIQIFVPGVAWGQALFNMSPVRTIAMVMIPRLLVPVTAYLTHRLLQKPNNKIVNKSTYVFTAFVGSMTNTVFFLGFLYLLFMPELQFVAEQFGTTKNGLLGLLGTIVATNGLMEALAAVIIVPAVCVPVALIKGYVVKRKGTVDDSNT